MLPSADSTTMLPHGNVGHRCLPICPRLTPSVFQAIRHASEPVLAFVRKEPSTLIWRHKMIVGENAVPNQQSASETPGVNRESSSGRLYVRWRVRFGKITVCIL